MIIYWDGRLYYSDAVVWAAAGSLVLAVPAAWALHSRPSLWPSEQVLGALDLGLAAVVFNAVLGAWLRWSLLPGWVAGRPALYALRATSALIGSASLIWLAVQLMPRQILAVAALCSLCISYNAASWSAALWLHLQDHGLGDMLPATVRDLLLHTPPLELLGTDAPTVVSRCWQMVGLLLVPHADRPAALSRLSPDFRARLLQPGLQAELPPIVAELVQPWSSGPDYLRVRPLSHALIPHTNGYAASPSSPAPRGPAVDLAPARPDAPEWLLVFVLRQHVLRALGGGRGALLSRVGFRAARLLALSALGMLLLRHRRRLRRVLPAKLRRVAILAAAFVLARQLRAMNLRQKQQRHTAAPPA